MSESNRSNGFMISAGVLGAIVFLYSFLTKSAWAGESIWKTVALILAPVILATAFWYYWVVFNRWTLGIAVVAFLLAGGWYFPKTEAVVVALLGGTAAVIICFGVRDWTPADAAKAKQEAEVRRRKEEDYRDQIDQLRDRLRELSVFTVDHGREAMKILAQQPNRKHMAFLLHVLQSRGVVTYTPEELWRSIAEEQQLLTEHEALLEASGMSKKARAEHLA